MTSGDKDNLEAAAAAYYFPALFGTGFTRSADDLYVAANVDEESTLAPALKHALFGLMNADILSGGQHHSVAYAMERLVQSLRTGMEKGGALALPKLLAWQPHGYE